MTNETWVLKGHVVKVLWIAGSLAKVTFDSGNTVYYSRRAFQYMAQKVEQ